MNVFGKRERSWRKARKRGVSPIIATILLVAITVVLAAVLYVLISGLTSGGANTVPIGTTFAFGSPAQSSTCGATYTTPGDCYAVGIQSAGSTATTGNIHFAVLKAGTGQSFGTVKVVGAGGTTYATFTYSSSGGTWDHSVGLNSTDTLVLSAAAVTTSMSGWSFEAIGVGALAGTTSVALP